MSSVEASAPVRIVVGFLLAFTAFATLIVVAVAMTDPGGVEGAAIAALWGVPMLALMAFCWFRPVVAERVVVGLAVLVGVLVLVSVFVDDVARDLEDDHGPVRAIVLLALGGILGVLALHRPMTSGRTLTALGAVVFVTSLAGRGSRPLAVVVLPLLLAGVLIWVLASASRRTRSDTSLE